MNTNSVPHFIIYSHGFGVRKDDIGLMTDIALSFAEEAQSLLFEYNEIDEEAKTLIVPPFSVQAAKLKTVIEKTQELHPNAIIDLVAHSQGTMVAGVAQPTGIRKTIFLAPVLDKSIQRSVDRYAANPKANINLNGMSQLPPKDGFARFVPKKYWSERMNLNVFDLYNKLAELTELIVLNANQDQLLGTSTDLKDLSPKIKIESLDGDHSFNGEARSKLLKTIKKYLTESI